MNEIKRFVRSNTAVVVLAAGCIIFSIFVKGFFSPKTVGNVLSQLSVQALLAAGMLFAMLLGGMDLSVGAAGALAGILAAYAENWLLVRLESVPVILSVLTLVCVAVVTGIAIGSGIGAMVAYMHIPGVVCSLALMYGIRGLAFAVAGGQPVYVGSKSFSALGTAKLLRFGGMTTGLIPVNMILAGVLVIAVWLVLTRTALGGKIYAVGKSRQAAEKAGINAGKVIQAGYMICSVMAALAGVICASGFQNGLPGAMEGYEMYALGAVLLGGVSLRGGRGTVGKVFIGAAAVTVLKTGMEIAQLSSYWHKMVMAAVILFAVYTNVKGEENGIGGSSV